MFMDKRLVRTKSVSEYYFENKKNSNYKIIWTIVLLFVLVIVYAVCRRMGNLDGNDLSIGLFSGLISSIIVSLLFNLYFYFENNNKKKANLTILMSRFIELKNLILIKEAPYLSLISYNDDNRFVEFYNELIVTIRLVLPYCDDGEISVLFDLQERMESIIQWLRSEIIKEDRLIAETYIKFKEYETYFPDAEFSWFSHKIAEDCIVDKLFEYPDEQTLRQSNLLIYAFRLFEKSLEKFDEKFKKYYINEIENND